MSLSPLSRFSWSSYFLLFTFIINFLHTVVTETKTEMRSFMWASVAMYLHLIAAEVAVSKMPQIIYDRDPILRIKGTGFNVEASAISLGFSSIGGDTLIPGEDFSVSIDDEGLVLKAFANRRFASTTFLSSNALIKIHKTPQSF